MGVVGVAIAAESEGGRPHGRGGGRGGRRGPVPVPVVLLVLYTAYKCDGYRHSHTGISAFPQCRLIDMYEIAMPRQESRHTMNFLPNVNVNINFSHLISSPPQNSPKQNQEQEKGHTYSVPSTYYAQTQNHHKASTSAIPNATVSSPDTAPRRYMTISLRRWRCSILCGGMGLCSLCHRGGGGWWWESHWRFVRGG